ncbi:Serpentine receptor class gamma-13 [Caenorhabditis elegans]|uniref:Serpentine receptor class gamma-13 n=1 Tax=Caenorhabditis elegans TaxID=6239 RepID=SRG13_CAEEL|nr:Serpentine receptor class gamma-13 [Caenorhabditis elegans]P46567.1 RecName: Full=Serpentine receptor class gamma-13; Short=Protein srg-13 [Caenorhabditis elegans]CAA86460.1 Serpentine receptor class gamma-13 [Caenorhabditis elegans]|eukprot:NP_497953.1 Serpentine receptor class gamma-13 [Caenorhabditis elegans]
MSTQFSLSSNISYDDPISFECDTSYDSGLELLKYIIQVTLLSINFILNFLIIRVTMFSKNNDFRENSFFIIYAADLIMGMYMSLSEILVGRLFIYVTLLCPILAPYFFTPSIFLKIFFTLSHYSQGFKTVSQVFLSFNRMTCVVFPVGYSAIWKRILTPIIIVLFVLPIGIIWNVLISRVYANPSFGGFSVNYIKLVSWASLSKLHLTYFIVSLILIIVISGVTLYALLILKHRIKSAEQTLTIATMVLSLEFSFLSVIQIYFAFFSSSTSEWRPFLLRVMYFTYDLLNFSTTIIFISCNPKLRKMLLKRMQSSVTVGRSTSNSTIPVRIIPALIH